MTEPYPPQHGPGPQYGTAPQYGAPGAPGPKKRSLLPWLIAAVVALIAALGVLVFVLLRADDGTPASNAAATATVPSDQGLGDTDGDAVVPPEYDGPEQQGEIIPADDGTGFGYDASMDRVTAFMDQVILGDYPAAISHGGQEFQAIYSDGTDLFAQEIAEATGGGTLYNYSVDSVTWDPVNEGDLVDISIEMEEGWMDEFFVLVGAEDGRLVIVGFQ
jgi:hypothetical protein